MKELTNKGDDGTKKGHSTTGRRSGRKGEKGGRTVFMIRPLKTAVIKRMENEEKHAEQKDRR